MATDGGLRTSGLWRIEEAVEAVLCCVLHRVVDEGDLSEAAADGASFRVQWRATPRFYHEHINTRNKTSCG